MLTIQSAMLESKYPPETTNSILTRQLQDVSDNYRYNPKHRNGTDDSSRLRCFCYHLCAVVIIHDCQLDNKHITTETNHGAHAAGSDGTQERRITQAELSKLSWITFQSVETGTSKILNIS